MQSRYTITCGAGTFRIGRASGTWRRRRRGKESVGGKMNVGMLASFDANRALGRTILGQGNRSLRPEKPVENFVDCAYFAAGPRQGLPRIELFRPHRATI